MKTCWRLYAAGLFAILLFAHAGLAQTIWPPEGMNIPGGFNGWSNPPNVNAFAGIQKAGGKFLLDTNLPTRMYRTRIEVASSGADATGGTYNWLFTSGPPPSGYYNNKWANVSVTMDSVQTYAINTGADNNITLTDGKFYTVNYVDNGYNNTEAIWIETATFPVAIVSVTQSPLAGSVPPEENVQVTVVTQDLKSSEENFFVRYTTNNGGTWSLLPVTFSGGTSGTATIPGQSGGTTVKYYAISTKDPSPATKTDMKVLEYNSNNGTFYSYSIPAPTYTITASSGPNGSITPSGSISVTAGDDQEFVMTPSPGYFIDSVIVDNGFEGTSSPYTFTNVQTNHTIRVVFARNVDVTFRVNMAVKIRKEEFNPASDQVFVRGSFNGWGTTKMSDPDMDSIYSVTLAIHQNRNIEYKFFKSPSTWEDNISNRTYYVPDEAEVTLPVVYFDNDNPSINVTFRINMSKQMRMGAFRPDSGDEVAVRGSFNDWGSDILEDSDHDSIYTGTLSMSADQQIFYKFWKTWRCGSDWEVIDGDNFANRSATLQQASEELPVVHYQPEPMVVVEKYSAQWNMVSVPLNVCDARRSVLFPGAVTPAFGFDGGYIPTEEMALGSGYWLRFGVSSPTELQGNPVSNLTVPVKSGWNMIGSISIPVETDNIGSDPEGILASRYFGYDGGYSPVSSLTPGRAYWVKARQEGNIFLDAALGARGAKQVSLLPTDELSTFVVTDRFGNSQTLFVGTKLDRRIADQYELPPMPPEGSFDVRFANNRSVEFLRTTDENAFPLRISAIEYPVTIRWELRNDIESGTLKVGSQEYLCGTTGSIEVDGAELPIVLYLTGEMDRPLQYELSSNYPNPFNPSTVIRYGLPVESHVSLKIFNVLGQEIGQIAGGIQGPGMHEIEWHADQFPSGMYYYRLEASSISDPSKNFRDIRKMLLLK